MGVLATWLNLNLSHYLLYFLYFGTFILGRRHPMNCRKWLRLVPSTRKRKKLQVRPYSYRPFHLLNPLIILKEALLLDSSFALFDLRRPYVLDRPCRRRKTLQTRVASRCLQTERASAQTFKRIYPVRRIHGTDFDLALVELSKSPLRCRTYRTWISFDHRSEWRMLTTAF